MAAPKGNQNSKGHGAPKGNRNAETHGARSRPDTTAFTAADWAEVESAGMVSDVLARLVAKRIDLERRMTELEASPLDRFTTSGATTKTAKGNTETSYWESKFSRMEKLETAYVRLLGNIMKAAEASHKLEAEKTRLELEREKLKFSKEKAAGIFEFEDDE